MAPSCQSVLEDSTIVSFHCTRSSAQFILSYKYETQKDAHKIPKNFPSIPYGPNNRLVCAIFGVPLLENDQLCDVLFVPLLLGFETLTK